MYNTDFLPQLEEFRRRLFGSVPSSPTLPYEDINSLAHFRPRGHGSDDACRYMPPPEMIVVPCHEDTNGEWIADPVEDTDYQGEQPTGDRSGPQR